MCRFRMRTTGKTGGGPDGVRRLAFRCTGSSLEPLLQMVAAVEVVNRKPHPAGEQHHDRRDDLSRRGDVLFEDVQHAPDRAHEADQPNNRSNHNNLNLEKH